MDLKFIDLVKKMRQAQKGYIKNKWHPVKSKEYLNKCNKLESEVDRYLIDHQINQGELF